MVEGAATGYIGGALGEDGAISGCGLNSFDPNTKVLLSDGKAEPIKQLKVGDTVASADPTTGKYVGGRKIVATIINHDNNLIDVTVDTGHHHIVVIHTTTEHPFWDNTTHTWVPAAHLVPGHTLASIGPTADARVLATHLTPGVAYRYNLTIQQLHTYYVLAGTTPVLVHNCNLKPGEQYVYRAVKSDELNQILSTRRYANTLGQEVKYFSTTPEGAAQYAKAAYGMLPDEGAYTLTRGVIQSSAISPDSVIESLADGGGGIDALALSEEEMSQIGRVRILPFMPVP
jgi:hypothetical protein